MSTHVAKISAGIRALTLVLALSGAAAAHARLMTVDDYLKIQMLGTIEVAAAGDLVAVLLSRPSEAGDNYRVPLQAESRIPLRNDLLVISPANGAVVLNVEGKADSSSVVATRWSPDASKLAYLRTDRYGHVSLHVWDVASGRTRALAENVRPFFPYVRQAGGDAAVAAIAWLNAREIILTQVGDAQAEDAANPERAAARAASGGESVRVWQSQHVAMCRPADRLAIVRVSDGATKEVARGPLLGASLSRDGSAVVVVSGQSYLQPPKLDPLPAHLRSQRAPDGVPFVRWEAIAFVRNGDAWTARGPRAMGVGAITPDTLPRWRPDGRAWAVLQEPNPFAIEPAAEMLTAELGENAIAAKSFATHREGRTALSAIESGAPQTPAASAPAAPAPAAGSAVPESLAERVGRDAMLVGTTRSGSKILVSRANNSATLWAVNGEQALELVQVNHHLREVSAPQPLPVKYSANGGERTGWLHLPPGTQGALPVVVTAYPLTMGIPSAMALPPEGTDPVLYDVLARGIAVYVADLRIQMPGPSIDEPVARILSEMQAGVKALQASGKVAADNIFFYGHSFGGYTAVTLLAHTSYFRGIIAGAPLGDLASYAFSSGRNYDPECAPVQILSRQMMHEYPGSSELPPVNNLLMKMGGPPYALREKYLRNSPLLDMKDAVTPALIIQGAEDAFADGERIFNTLYRLGVDAELLYYWGEGHMLYAPANVRDVTKRASDWIVARAKAPSAARSGH